MISNRREQTHIMNRFPDVELSYEKNLYKKVQHKSDIYLTIPKGKKYFAWFTTYKSTPACLLLELNRNKDSINLIKIANSSFNKMLTLGSGTIFYGTIFNVNKNNFFNIENIYYYKGKNISKLNQLDKFNILNNILKNHIKNISYTSNNIVFGLPIIETNREKLIETIKTLSYDIYCLQHRSLKNNYPFKNEKIYVEKKIYANLLVKPHIENDIYEAFSSDNDKLVSQGFTYIPDYKTSVFMNKLFRNIKENYNLDTLEESDDEEEYENVQLDKYVHLDKSYVMNCLYSNKFKYWIPLELTKGSITIHSKISVKNNIRN